MDLGGTNLRVMIMEIEPGEPMRSKAFNTRIPNWAMHGKGTEVSTFRVYHKTVRMLEGTPITHREEDIH